MEQMLDSVDDKYIAEVIEEKNNRSKKRFMKLRNCAAAVVICAAVLGSGISVWAAVSDAFRDWIEKTFPDMRLQRLNLSGRKRR